MAVCGAPRGRVMWGIGGECNRRPRAGNSKAVVRRRELCASWRATDNSRPVPPDRRRSVPDRATLVRPRFASEQLPRSFRGQARAQDDGFRFFAHPAGVLDQSNQPIAFRGDG